MEGQTCASVLYVVHVENSVSIIIFSEFARYWIFGIVYDILWVFYPTQHYMINTGALVKSVIRCSMSSHFKITSSLKAKNNECDNNQYLIMFLCTNLRDIFAYLLIFDHDSL